MVEKQKTGTKKTQSKKGIKIDARILAPLHLTQKERKVLNQTLKAAGETFVKSLPEPGVIVVECGDHNKK